MAWFNTLQLVWLNKVSCQKWIFIKMFSCSVVVRLFLAWALKLTASFWIAHLSLRITVGTKAANKASSCDFYKVYQNVRWKSTKIQTFQGWSLFLSGLKRYMQSRFQFSSRRVESSNVLYNSDSGMSIFITDTLTKSQINSTLEGKVEKNFRVFKGIFQERSFINKTKESSLCVTQVAQVRNMSIGEHRHSCVTFEI